MEQPDPKHYNDFLQNSIQILDTLVLSIELPPAIVAAINRQTEQFYQIQEYKYRVEREVEEAKRKQVEANGIAAFQRTVSKGISDSYLRWRGIEATLALAQSRNAKVVIIGSGKEGLPIILGNMGNAPRRRAAAPAAAGQAPPPHAGDRAETERHLGSAAGERRVRAARGRKRRAGRRPKPRSRRKGRRPPPSPQSVDRARPVRDQGAAVAHHQRHALGRGAEGGRAGRATEEIAGQHV